MKKKNISKKYVLDPKAWESKINLHNDKNKRGFRIECQSPL